MQEEKTSPVREKRSHARYYIIGTIIGIIVLIAWLFIYADTPSDIAIEVDAPLEVEVGDLFGVTTTITNHSARRTHRLHSIDIATDYLDGAALIASSPTYTEAYDIPFMPQRSYEFGGHPIGPGETLEVRFDLKALKAGDFGGDYDICINKAASCLFQTIRTIVR